jgi:hypothetical protein
MLTGATKVYERIMRRLEGPRLLLAGFDFAPVAHLNSQTKSAASMHALVTSRHFPF